MAWIEVAEEAPVEDRDSDEPVPRGLPRRAPYMDDVLEQHGKDPDEYLPIDYSGNRTAQVPRELAEAMAERYGHITINVTD